MLAELVLGLPLDSIPTVITLVGVVLVSVVSHRGEGPWGLEGRGQSWKQILWETAE